MMRQRSQSAAVVAKELRASSPGAHTSHTGAPVGGAPVAPVKFGRRAIDTRRFGSVALGGRGPGANDGASGG